MSSFSLMLAILSVCFMLYGINNSLSGIHAVLIRIAEQLENRE